MNEDRRKSEARLFSALVLPSAAVLSLQQELARHRGVAGTSAMRWNSPEQWHITLGFYGTENIASRAEWLRARLAEAPAPRVRVESAGTFRGVLWAGVVGAGLADLAARAQTEADRREFRAHVTLARGSRQAALIEWQHLLTEYRGPEWTATTVALMRSDRAPGGNSGPRYTSVEQVPLTRPGASGHANGMPC